MQVARPVVTVPGITAAAAVAAPGISAAVVVSSVVVGITTSLILFCSHFHQIADDKAANKLSPLVKLGTANGLKVTYCLATAAPVCLQHMYADVAHLTSVCCMVTHIWMLGALKLTYVGVGMLGKCMRSRLSETAIKCTL